jgi:hypothetical protein
MGPFGNAPSPLEAPPAKLTPDQAAIVTAYTGILSGAFSEFHKYAERLAGRPVYTHELADKEVWAQLKERSKPDFLAIVAND